MTHTALIVGVSGQDGALLAKHLIDEGYLVYGTTRRFTDRTYLNLKKLGLSDKAVKVFELSMLDLAQIKLLLSKLMPNEIYNLSAQSSVGLSFSKPCETLESICTVTANLLEAIRLTNKDVKFFNASSGDCFGDTAGLPISETTQFDLRSPYALAKANASQVVDFYRKSFGLYAVNGYLFNHESILRSENFVTMKVVHAAHSIANGSKEKLKLGNIDIKRDWGWAPEYVVAMHKMVLSDNPQNYIISTGSQISLKSFVSAVFSYWGLDWEEYVIADHQEYIRQNEIAASFGLPQRIYKDLQWQAKISGINVARALAMEFEKSLI